MTKRDLSAVKEKLEAQLQVLEARAERIDNRLSDPGSPDWEENATIHEDDEVLSVLGARAEGEIQDIRLALKRIGDGTYGLCVTCNGMIPLPRLEALPFTSTCVTCASLR